MLLNGSVLTKLLDLTVNELIPEKSGILFEQCFPLVRHELVVLQHTHHIISIVLRQGDGFINQNNMWWACSHTGKPRCL
jgi:hypothetical protein